MDSGDWDDRYRASDRLWSTTPNLFVADRLRHTRPGRGLDLAAGEGRNAVWLASIGWQMTAVDFSEVAIARGLEQTQDVQFVQSDVLEWESKVNFDLVLVAYLHLRPPDFEKVVRRAREYHGDTDLEENASSPEYETPVRVRL